MAAIASAIDTSNYITVDEVVGRDIGVGGRAAPPAFRCAADQYTTWAAGVMADHLLTRHYGTNWMYPSGVAVELMRRVNRMLRERKDEEMARDPRNRRAEEVAAVVSAAALASIAGGDEGNG